MQPGGVSKEEQIKKVRQLNATISKIVEIPTKKVFEVSPLYAYPLQGLYDVLKKIGIGSLPSSQLDSLKSCAEEALPLMCEIEHSGETNTSVSSLNASSQQIYEHQFDLLVSCIALFQVQTEKIPSLADQGRPPTTDSTGFLNGVLSAFALVTAWVFVIGWTYLHTYYTYFGVNISSVDFPIHQYFMFCYAQFVSFHWLGLLLGVLLLVLFLLTWAGTRTTSQVYAVLICIAYLACFLAGFQIALYDGRVSAMKDMGVNSASPQIILEFKEAEKLRYSTMEEAFNSANLRLLLETGDRLFVFEPVDTNTEVVQIGVLEIDRRETQVSMRFVRVK